MLKSVKSSVKRCYGSIEVYLCSMRVIFFSAAGVFILLLVGATLISGPQASAGEKDLTIALRQIGHSILLQAGDSTSRVLPVKKMNRMFFCWSFKVHSPIYQTRW